MMKKIENCFKSKVCRVKHTDKQTDKPTLDFINLDKWICFHSTGFRHLLGPLPNKDDRHKSRAPSNRQLINQRPDQRTNRTTNKGAHRLACTHGRGTI